MLWELPITAVAHYFGATLKYNGNKDVARKSKKEETDALQQLDKMIGLGK